MYFIEGRHAKKKIVDQYVNNLMVALKIHRFTARLVNVKFKSVLDDEADGLCLGDDTEVFVSIGTKDKSFMRQMQALAHEMVHRKQDELGLVKDEIKDGATGSPIENQAHAVAGILMRNYGKINKQDAVIACFNFNFIVL